MPEPHICQKRPLVQNAQPGEYWWCACGRSKEQPFCDGSHQGTGLGPKKVSRQRRLVHVQAQRRRPLLRRLAQQVAVGWQWSRCDHSARAVVKAGLSMSMTESNHSTEPALAERVNGILKQEGGVDGNFETKPAARQATAEGVGLYNNRRPHTALGFRTPEQVQGPGN